MLGLHNNHPWLYQGIPYAWFSRFSINGTPIVGHVARQVRGTGAAVGEDIERLRMQGKKFSLDEKRRICGHLCAAIAAFEKLQLVHGDISTKNLMIATAPDGGVAGILCDYDGFYHPSQKLLPEVFNGQACRPIGSQGFQSPSIIERRQKAQSGIYVDTDRFALGAMICDIMAWESEWINELGREELLSEEVTLSRSLRTLPGKVRSRCKEGFDLLEVALNAKDNGQMPSPQDWFQSVVGVAVPDPATDTLVKSFTHKPAIELFIRRGTQVKSVFRTSLNANKGDLGQIDPRLMGVTYENDNGMLSLHVDRSVPVILRRSGKQNRRPGPVKIYLQSGDTLYFDEWQIEFTDVP